MSVRSNVILSFNSNLGEIVRLTIPRADTSLTATRAEATMEAMIDGGIVVTGNGVPISVRGAELVTTQRTPIPMA